MKPNDSTPTDEPPIAAELRELVSKAKAGDPKVLARIRQILDEHREVWEHVGDLEKVVQEAWINLLASDSPLGAESFKRKANSIREELGGESPSKIESLLIGQIVSAWFELNHAQMKLAEPITKTIGQGVYNLKRGESAQRKYIAAIRSLATVRALLPRGLVPLSHLRIFNGGKETA